MVNRYISCGEQIRILTLTLNAEALTVMQ